MAAEARFDRWRALLQEARMWARSTNQQSPGKEEHGAAVTKYFNELRQWEDYFAYPGQTLLKSLEERIASTSGAARLVQSMSAALLTSSYRCSTADWEGEGQAAINLDEQVPVSGEESVAHRPGAGSRKATQTRGQIHL
jgi:arginine decarboxylase